MSALPPEALAALRRAAAARRDIARLVYAERYVEPRSEPPFSDRTIVIVLDDLPSEPQPALVRELVHLLSPALPRGFRTSWALPSPVGLAPATRDGVVVFERDAA